MVQDKVFYYMSCRVNDRECRAVEVQDSYDCFLSQTRGLGWAMEKVVEPEEEVCTLIFKMSMSLMITFWTRMIDYLLRTFPILNFVIILHKYEYGTESRM